MKADVELEKVRLHLRLAQELKFLNAGQYEHASRAVVDIGRLLGGWLKRDPHGREANGACVAARGTTTPTTRARLTGAWCAPLG